MNGVRVSRNGEEKEIEARVVADCSGIPALARTSLPDGYGVENTPLTPEDMFYVVLRYVKIKNKESTARPSGHLTRAGLPPAQTPRGR